MLRHPSISTLFPYTTLFRSAWREAGGSAAASEDQHLVSRVHLYHTMNRKSNKRIIFLLHFERIDRNSTRLNSSHPSISYAVFCLKKKKKKKKTINFI